MTPPRSAQRGHLPGVGGGPLAEPVSAQLSCPVDGPGAAKHCTTVDQPFGNIRRREPDGKLRGYDAAVLMEVIEHVDPPRLPALEDAVFGHARPGTVVVTTPNAEYYVRYEGLGAGRFRHADHRFEWTRAEFAAWVDRVSATHGYTATISGVGDDPEVGSPTQIAVLTRKEGSSS